jgi:hypothetical protein
MNRSSSILPPLARGGRGGTSPRLHTGGEKRIFKGSEKKGGIAWLIACLIGLTLVTPLFADEPVLRFDEKETFEVTGLSAERLRELTGRIVDKNKSPVLAVFVDRGEQTSPATPMAGTTTVENGVLRFRPRYPLVAGLKYRVVFDPDGKPATQVAQLVSLPNKSGKPTAIVTVFPTQDLLPENQLKFYIHFSAPMARGDAYRHVRLLNDKGEAIRMPFLELDQELWDANQQRFTLFFDPGRIKRGLKPREEDGPVLEEGKRYTFEIDKNWLDADGNALARTYRKTFKAGPPDDQPIDPANWKIAAPAADSRRPLEVRFPKAMEHALAERLIWVEDAKEQKVPGKAELVDHEQRWAFTPKQPWSPGQYRIAIDTALEDLAGNNVGRPFEVDVLHPIEKKIEAKIVYLPVLVRKN